MVGSLFCAAMRTTLREGSISVMLGATMRPWMRVSTRRAKASRSRSVRATSSMRTAEADARGVRGHVGVAEETQTGGIRHHLLQDFHLPHDELRAEELHAGDVGPRTLDVRH